MLTLFLWNFLLTWVVCPVKTPKLNIDEFRLKNKKRLFSDFSVITNLYIDDKIKENLTSIAKCKSEYLSSKLLPNLVSEISLYIYGRVNSQEIDIRLLKYWSHYHVTWLKEYRRLLSHIQLVNNLNYHFISNVCIQRTN